MQVVKEKKTIHYAIEKSSHKKRIVRGQRVIDYKLVMSKNGKGKIEFDLTCIYPLRLRKSIVDEILPLIWKDILKEK